MTNNVIDFSKYVDERTANKIITGQSLATMAQITQEINAVLIVDKHLGVDFKKGICDLASDADTEKCYAIAELLELHAGNMNNLARAIYAQLGEPADEAKQKINEEKQNITSNFDFSSSIVAGYLSVLLCENVEQERQSR